MASAPFTAETSRRSAKRSIQPPSGRPHQASSLSSEAEALVARELTARGWAVLARNARYVGSELDLVVQKGRTLAIVEVKARQGRYPHEIATLLPRRKLAALKRGALAFITATRADVDTIRLDLALVQRTGKRTRGVEGTVHVTYHAGVHWG